MIRCKSFARKFLRCGVVAFADEASSLSLQNNKISVGEPRKPRRFLAAPTRCQRLVANTLWRQEKTDHRSKFLGAASILSAAFATVISSDSEIAVG